MARKQKPPEQEEHGESAPMWIVSFADLVTLLMSFFVILAAGRPQDTATDPEFARVVASIKAAFNNLPEASTSLDPRKDLDEILRKIQALIEKKDPPRKPGKPARGDTREEGIPGRSFRVRRLRDGMEITAGGPVFFEPLSAALTPQGRREIAALGEILKGHRNMIEVRGHAIEEPRPENWTYQDAMKLSYDRASNVTNELIKAGIDPRAIRIVAAGPNEPLVRGVYDPARTGENRRVEILLRETLLDDYSGAALPVRRR
ncbi:MAG TPA: flagellar motor protein MotB [Phycisphaerae bacterium]|jgi:chemotaxis protein MotB|nr:OmpA family protein [Phycisphaerae bacterium]HOB76723.1 flagellar motor protein MotB [Phycisphaerae bacterium]HOJ56764.1 flagellar motor protein MotB [Phycisphaerae bacterium]HOL28509.1 flagellar motor protein MotB [Phycisphaerae bacterium]HPP23034.1 flagellar motor protein MotB [Phycisphaerae bacterium]